MSSWTLRSPAVTLEAQPSENKASPAGRVGDVRGQMLTVNPAAEEAHPECAGSKCAPGGLPVSLPPKKLPPWPRSKAVTPLCLTLTGWL